MVSQPPHLHTDRLTLRPLTPDLAPDLFALYSHPDAMVYWDCPPHIQLSETVAMIEQEIAPPGACWWALFPAGQECAVGVVGYLGNPGVPGMGYILHPDYWRQGLMREAVSAALDYGFDELGLGRVELWIDSQNRASLALANRLGFSLRAHFGQKYGHHHQAHEKMVYGITCSEWRRGSPQPGAADQFYAVQPILSVADVQETAEFYRDQLGFEIDFLYGAPPTHGAVSRREWSAAGATVQLSQAATGSAATDSMALYFFVGPAIEKLYAAYGAAGVTMERSLERQPWGMWEFAVRDCNGVLLRFGTPG